MTIRIRPDNPECLCVECECCTIPKRRYSRSRIENVEETAVTTGKDSIQNEDFCTCGECVCETCHVDGNVGEIFCWHSPVWGVAPDIDKGGTSPELGGDKYTGISQSFLCWNPSNMLENARTIYNQIKLWEKDEAEEAS